MVCLFSNTYAKWLKINASTNNTDEKSAKEHKNDNVKAYRRYCLPWKLLTTRLARDYVSSYNFGGHHRKSRLSNGQSVHFIWKLCLLVSSPKNFAIQCGDKVWLQKINHWVVTRRSTTLVSKSQKSILWMLIEMAYSWSALIAYLIYSWEMHIIEFIKFLNQTKILNSMLSKFRPKIYKVNIICYPVVLIIPK